MSIFGLLVGILSPILYLRDCYWRIGSIRYIKKMGVFGLLQNKDLK
jgi:hypothetical protein